MVSVMMDDQSRSYLTPHQVRVLLLQDSSRTDPCNFRRLNHVLNILIGHRSLSKHSIASLRRQGHQSFRSLNCGAIKVWGYADRNRIRWLYNQSSPFTTGSPSTSLSTQAKLHNQYCSVMSAAPPAPLGPL